MAESVEQCIGSEKSDTLGSCQNKHDGENNVADVNNLDGAESESVVWKQIRSKMLARVALSDAHFKHQQRGDPDLTLDEKIEICQNFLDSSKLKFLEKFWRYLDLEDIEYFEKDRNMYEIEFYMTQIKRNKNVYFQKNRAKNRRYEAMKELISKGEYFSDDEMKFREPFLYEQMVGQYLTQEEIQGKVDKSDLTFSSILLKHIDQLDENVRFDAEKDKEEGQMEEEEDDEEEDDEMEVNTEQDEDCDEPEKKISDEKKQELKAEFLTIMQEKFLNGEDKSFDYRKVDNNDAYDDLDLLNADAEDKYFNDDDT